jgi:hypothetical protein
MTERTGVVRIAVWTAVLALLAAGCTDSHGMGASGPKGSTETGNPPALDSGAVSLVVSENAVHVVGEPGAVMPAEGTVEVTVLRTGEKITGQVNPDGSFDVQVDGTLDDVFEVRVVHEGRSSMTITVMRGGAMVGGGDGGTMLPPAPNMQCAEADMRYVNAAMMIAASAQTACDTDDDCDIMRIPSGCESYSCDVRYVARAVQSGLEGSLVQAHEIACPAYDMLGCEPAPDCVADPIEPACIAGRCAAKGSPNPCDDCEDFEIGWRAISPGILPAEIDPTAHTITGCGTLTMTTYDMRTCSSMLPACGVVMGGDWKGRLDGLLAHPDVATAIAEGGTHGEPQEYSGIEHELTVGGSTFRFRRCANHPNRMCEPSGIDDLIDYLHELQMAYRCRLNDCTSPFDRGQSDMLVQVYWHDPATRTCLRRGRGAGGNDNYYMTLDDCQQACPPPTDQAGCGPDRTFATNRCVDCGPLGPCLTPTTRCLAACESDADCETESDPLGNDVQCVDGLCELVLFCE